MPQDVLLQKLKTIPDAQACGQLMDEYWVSKQRAYEVIRNRISDAHLGIQKDLKKEWKDFKWIIFPG